MAGKIIIADRETPYAQALAMRIRQHCPTCTATAVSDDSMLVEQLKSASEPVTLIVSEAHFPIDDLPASVIQVIILSLHRQQNASSQTDIPVRMGSVLPILKRLDQNSIHTPAIDVPDILQPEQLSGNPQTTNTEQIAYPDVDLAPAVFIPAPPQNEIAPRIFIFLTQTTKGRSSHFVDTRCKMLSGAGSRVIYLPLMPNFYCRQWAASDSGYGLSDLILRIGTGGLTVQDLGTYSAIDRLGRIQFRPTDRADDLLQCRTEDLYRLCALLRERIYAETGTLLVIEAVGIAFHKIQPLLPLCDQIEVIIPEGTEYAAAVLRREISDVLADLPSTVKVIRVPEHSAIGLKDSDTAREVATSGQA